jgi:hypothetical protein
MIIDHTGAVYFPELIILRIIGRLAFPIFAFLIAEGVYYTKDINKYFARMLIFALITEVVFDLAFYNSWLYLGHQNVLFTFTFAIGGYILASRFGQNEKSWQWVMMIIVALIGGLFQVDHSWFGIMIVMVFILMREQKELKFLMVAFIIGAVTFMGSSLYIFSVMAIPLLWFYNQKLGPRMKYLFYTLYPGHLLILYLIRFI